MGLAALDTEAPRGRARLGRATATRFHLATLPRGQRLATGAAVHPAGRDDRAAAVLAGRIQRDGLGRHAALAAALGSALVRHRAHRDPAQRAEPGLGAARADGRGARSGTQPRLLAPPTHLLRPTGQRDPLRARGAFVAMAEAKGVWIDVPLPLYGTPAPSPRAAFPPPATGQRPALPAAGAGERPAIGPGPSGY